MHLTTEVTSVFGLFIKQVTSSTPIDYLKSRNGNVSENDIELVKDLQAMV